MLPTLLALAIVAFLFLVVVCGQSDEFTASRSTTLSAPPEAVFPHVNNLHAWEAWSPWARMDPNAKSTFEGPAAGTGASMKWEGNRKVGVGKMAITESQPVSVIRFRLDFEKPMQATNHAEFTFRPEAGGTMVTWTMSGTNGVMGKVMGLFMNCERMVGGQFEKGLANLKSVAESAPKQA